MFQFQSVDESNYQSVSRRACIIDMKARFLDATFLNQYLPEHEEWGIFARIPGAKDLLVSGPGVLAGHIMQMNFEANMQEADCIREISEYTFGGGDGGVTKRVMRTACGLEPSRQQAGERSDLTLMGPCLSRTNEKRCPRRHTGTFLLLQFVCHYTAIRLLLDAQKDKPKREPSQKAKTT